MIRSALQRMQRKVPFRNANMVGLLRRLDTAPGEAVAHVAAEPLPRFGREHTVTDPGRLDSGGIELTVLPGRQHMDT